MSPAVQGERDLQALLRSLSPALDPLTYWFCHVAPSWAAGSIPLLARLEESEGSTVVLHAGHGAEAGLEPSFVARRIVLTVHSDFAAVGMIAAVARALADRGVPCNVLAGVYHDHVFVGEGDTAAAMSAIHEVQALAMHGVRLDYLARHPQAIATLAQWHFEEWREILPEWTLERTVADLESHTGDGVIPTTIIALAGDEIVGSTSLLVHDIPGTEAWSPWLASVFVAPAWRNKRIGRLLVERAVADATAAGVPVLHLWTTGAERWYLDQGWQVVERRPHGSGTASIMDLDLRRERSTFQQDASSPWRRTMSEWSDRWQAILGDFERQRDELKVRVHLAQAEAREEMDRLEGKMDALRLKAQSAGSEAKDALKDIGGAAEQLANEIRQGLERVRKTL
jgi:predicted N-acetyltransferase YhbS